MGAGGERGPIEGSERARCGIVYLVVIGILPRHIAHHEYIFYVVVLLGIVISDPKFQFKRIDAGSEEFSRAVLIPFTLKVLLVCRTRYKGQQDNRRCLTNGEEYHHFHITTQYIIIYLY